MIIRLQRAQYMTNQSKRALEPVFVFLVSVEEIKNYYIIGRDNSPCSLSDPQILMGLSS